MSTKSDIDIISKEIRRSLKEGQDYLALEDRTKAFGAFERAQHLAFKAKSLIWDITQPTQEINHDS